MREDAFKPASHRGGQTETPPRHYFHHLGLESPLSLSFFFIFFVVLPAVSLFRVVRGIFDDAEVLIQRGNH